MTPYKPQWVKSGDNDTCDGAADTKSLKGTALRSVDVVRADGAAWPAESEEVASKAQAMAAGRTLTRDLVNLRADVMTPAGLEEAAAAVAHAARAAGNAVEMEVLRGGRELQEAGLEMLWSVGRAAPTPPRLIILHFNRGSAAEGAPVPCLLGKGVTMDTGGVNLKGMGLERMFHDMAGAGAVLGAGLSIALAGPGQKEVVVAVAAAENSIDGEAYLPGSILTSAKGLTVEVTNTDAEGRLCLADAMTYVQRNYPVNQLVDIATLTGACMNALGENAAGVFGREDSLDLLRSLQAAGEGAGELLWHLPMLEEHKKAVRSSALFADLNNAVKASAGASTAAAFLEAFVEDGVEWAHIDIAGPAFVEKPSARLLTTKGATGFGANTLAEHVIRLDQR